MGECTINDEPGSDNEFEDILFEEDYNVLHQSPDSFIDTEERHTPSPTPLRLPISIATPPPPIHSTPTNTHQIPTTWSKILHSVPIHPFTSSVGPTFTVTECRILSFFH